VFKRPKDDDDPVFNTRGQRLDSNGDVVKHARREDSDESDGGK